MSAETNQTDIVISGQIRIPKAVWEKISAEIARGVASSVFGEPAAPEDQGFSGNFNSADFSELDRIERELRAAAEAEPGGCDLWAEALKYLRPTAEDPEGIGRENGAALDLFGAELALKEAGRALRETNQPGRVARYRDAMKGFSEASARMGAARAAKGGNVH